MSRKKPIGDPFSWLYIDPNDVESIIKTLDLLLNQLNIEIKTITYSSKRNPIKIIESRSFPDFQYNIKPLGNRIFSVNLTRFTRRRTKKIEGKFILLKHTRKYVFMIITHEKTEYIKKVINPFIDRYYPLISRTFIDSFHMQKLLENLEKSFKNMKIRSNRVISKSRIISNGAKKEIESGIRWTDVPYRDTFQKAFENDEWVSSIDFTINPISEEIIDLEKEDTIRLFMDSIDCQINRYGFFKCNKKYSIFYGTILDEIAQKANKDLIFFDGRNRSMKEKLMTKPIIMKFDIEIFKDKSQNHKLIDALQKIPYSSLSIFHANPYLHCTFVDYRDGSSYDIWILSNDKITIVPQMRVSFASLERLSNHIFVGFREGILENFRELNNV